MKTLALTAFVVLAQFGAVAWAADAAKAPSKEAREKMAVAHEKMAACLRTDQDMKECHEALHKECKATMGESCHGMDKGMGGKHKH